MAALLAGCSDSSPDAASSVVSPPITAAATADLTTIATTAPTTIATTALTTAPTTAPTPTTTPVPTTAPPLVYTFPFVGKKVSYGRTHHDYPAVDVFGCGAIVVAPTDGTVLQTRDVDLWDPKVNSPANRGGRFVSMLGRDGVRYYFAHLDSVIATVGQAVQPGDPLGVMGQTGNARKSACHTHFGISWPCPENEWEVRRGEIWPAQYLDAWRAGERRSPLLEVFAAQTGHPDACEQASADPEAAAA